MIGRRLLILASLGAALLAAAPAAASSKVEGGEIYIKLQPVILEMWDENGVFHQIAIELSAVVPEQTNIPKSVSVKIKQALQVVPFEELQKGESTAFIKKTAIDLVHAEPGGAHVSEVLITKIMFK
jgi:hypothetical protein